MARDGITKKGVNNLRGDANVTIIVQAFLVRGAGFKRMCAPSDTCFRCFRVFSTSATRKRGSFLALSSRSQHLASFHRGQSSTHHIDMESSRVSLSFVAVLISLLAHPTCVDGFFVPAPACRPTAAALGSRAMGTSALASRPEASPRRMHEVWRRQASMSARQPGDGTPTG